MILYGLKTCDTCRKAARALSASHTVTFRDVRADPLSADEIAEFANAFGDALLNRSSTTWRGLSEQDRARPMAELLHDYPALMKRPVLKDGDKITLGWSPSVQAQW